MIVVVNRSVSLVYIKQRVVPILLKAGPASRATKWILDESVDRNDVTFITRAKPLSRRDSGVNHFATLHE